ncbi:TetR/AcrR family transcriptional regulator [Ohtaekwangia koreensis]|uniref:Transcriptional regulator, TetR family n=1 Tax=Ohtaekwangia koreensis TaxID=688867 RepID=A0A1T5KPX2_9BACT|nr:TetR/AcrR family transcriptional regulator [Ohtaekwangia koreensis]SKC65782.1 transcriptional regulator, TetR family [Ohtaekwangia koreensis]
MARTKDFDESEVLNKAVSLFWLKGYNGTSMQDLVDSLGISRSSLYDTYGDKHTLYLKALEFYQNTSGSAMYNIVTNATSSKEAIKQLLELVVNNLLNDKQHKGCFMVNAEVEVAPHDTEVRDMLCKNEKQIEEAFHLAIQRGQQSGEITNRQEARAITRFFLTTIKGIQVSAKSTTDKAYFDDIIKTALSVLG